MLNVKKCALLPEEQLLYYTKPHGIIFASILVWMFAGTVLFMMVAAQPSLNQLYAGLDYICYGLISLSVLGCISNIFVRYNYSEIIITNKRVLMYDRDILTQSLFEIFLDRIGGVQIDQSIVGVLLDYGVVTIVDSCGGRKPLFSIPDPDKFRQILQQRIRS